MDNFNNNSGYYNFDKENIVQDGSYYGGYKNNRPPKKSRKKHSTAVVLLASFLAAIIGAVSASAAYFAINKAGFEDKPSPITSESNQNVNINIDKTASSVAEAVALKSGESVVGIRTTSSVANFFFGETESTGEGSGVIYSADGYIITNYHVIESAVNSRGNAKIEVFIGDANSTPYTARAVGYHISSDLAVLKIDAKNLKPVELGSSDSLKVGQYVITIGAPGGLEFMGSVTYGIISGLDREVSANLGVPLIQTDAAINPGNSGGALLNTSGQLIGINSSKIVSEEFEGMGFAIPIDIVKQKVDRIIDNKNSPEPYIGIAISETYTPEALSYYGFPVGAVVQSVYEDGPAKAAGIRRGDIITEFNGKEIKDYDMFGDYLKDCEPQETIKLTIYRSGKYYTVNVTVASNTQ